MSPADSQEEGQCVTSGCLILAEPLSEDGAQKRFQDET